MPRSLTRGAVATLVAAAMLLAPAAAQAVPAEQSKAKVVHVKLKGKVKARIAQQNGITRRLGNVACTMTVVTINGSGDHMDMYGSTICDLKVVYIEQWIEVWRVGPTANPLQRILAPITISKAQARMGPKHTTAGKRDDRNVFYCGRVTTNAGVGQACAGVYGV